MLRATDHEPVAVGRLFHCSVHPILHPAQVAADGDGLVICRPEHFSGRTFWSRDEPFSEDPAAFVHHHYRNSWLLPLEATVVRHCTRRKGIAAATILGLVAALAIVGLGLGGGA